MMIIVITLDTIFFLWLFLSLLFLIIITVDNNNY